MFILSANKNFTGLNSFIVYLGTYFAKNLDFHPIMQKNLVVRCLLLVGGEGSFGDFLRSPLVILLPKQKKFIHDQAGAVLSQ